MKHAVEHASSDLAATTKIPGFRKGKVPQKVLEARVGRDRIFTEAVESHIGGWFWNAAGRREHPARLAARAQLRAADLGGRAVQLHRRGRRAAAARGRGLERARGAGSGAGRARGARRARAGGPARVGRRARPGRGPARRRTATSSSSTSSIETGEAQRDYVVQLGAGRLVEEIERGLRGMSPGETKKITYTSPEGEKKEAEATLKELKEPVLPPLDDELARAASEFETLEELRTEIELRLREAIQAELDADFRAGAVDKLVEASKVDISDSLVEATSRRAARRDASLTRSGAASTPRPTSASPARPPTSCARRCAARPGARSAASSSSRRSPTSSRSRSPMTRSRRWCASRPRLRKRIQRR